MAALKSSSLTEISESSAVDATKTLVSHSSSHGSTGKNKQGKKSSIKESLRRCLSNPEKKPTIQSQERTGPDTWKCVWDIERGYITDLIADQRPTTRQPQLSYFAYLGNNYQKKGRYQVLSGDAEVVINLGNRIVAQNWSSTCPNSEEKEFNENAVHIIEPMKSDRTQLVECCSCMCCVKATFYHCNKDGDFERNWAEEPCACETPGTEFVLRWGILGMLSLFMPCLVCYPIMKVCCRSPFNSFSPRKWKS